MAVGAIDIGASKIAIKFTTTNITIEDIFLLSDVSDFELEKIKLAHFLECAIRKINAPFKQVAIAAAPTVNAQGLVTRWPNRPSWEGFDIRSFLCDLFLCKVIVEDDGNAAALAEASVIRSKNMAYIGLGTGVSGGIILNNEIYRGSNGLAAEIGHIIVGYDGMNCTCGRNGCLQSYLSWQTICMYAGLDPTQRVTVTELRSVLTKYKIDLNMFLNKLVNPLIVAVININELMNMDGIIIGGRIITEFPQLIYLLNEKIIHYQRKGQHLGFIKESHYKEKSSLMGAELLAMAENKTLMS